MTKNQRIIAIAITGALLLTGYAFGRITNSQKATLAEDNKATVGQSAQNSSTQAAKEDQPFYLSDFKTGYSDGYNSGMAGDAAGVANTDRAGYNDGFKEGYADGYQTKMSEQSAPVNSNLRPATTRLAQQQVVYQPSSAPRKKNSTLKTVLTIAAPAAIGAGVGGAVGGGKGAGVGALIGGGGGALYHLIKNRNN